MDWNSVRQVLVALTEDLRPSPTTSQDSLLAARKDAAIAIAAGQEQWSFGYRLLYNPSRISLPPIQWEQYDNAKPVAVPTIAQRVFRRTTGLPFAPEFRSSINNPQGIKPSTTHGPFLDAFERSVYIDVFIPITVQEFGFGQGAHFFVGAPVTQTNPFIIRLGAGTVWIRADLFTKSNPEATRAPTDSFFGLKILSGVVQTPPIAESSRRLVLKLDGGPFTLSAFSMNPVTDVTFSFTRPALAGILTSISTGQAVVLGSTFNLQQQTPTNAFFDQSLGRLNFIMATDSSNFSPDSNLAGILDIEGTSAVTTPAWSVIVKTSSQKNFYAVSGPGGFCFSLKPGIKMQMKGDDMKVSLDSCSMITEPDSLLIAGATARAPMRTRSINLMEISIDKENQGSSLTFRPGYMTPFYYQSTADGSESWTLNANLSFALNQPRTVNNDRIPFESTYNLGKFWNTLTWSRAADSDITNLCIEASNDLSPTIVSYALKNLLLKADLPYSMEIVGVYKPGSLVSGGARLISFLRYTLPALPDPYVSNFELAVDPAAEKIGLGFLTAVSRWTAATSPSLDLKILTARVTAAKTMIRVNSNRREDDPILAGIVTSALQYWEPDFSRKEIESGLIPDLGKGQDFHIPNGATARGSFYNPPTLMDVSSNGSQFGVVFATRAPVAGPSGVINPDLPAPAADIYAVQEFQISDLMLESAAENVRVMALPAIQWEPVTEADIDTVPAKLREAYIFPYSGPSTQMAISAKTNSVRLVPVAPKEAVLSMVSRYNAESSVTVSTRFSLPFGMVALANMTSRTARFSATVDMIEFTLSGEEDPKTQLKPPELQPSDQFSFQPPPVLRLIPTPLPGQPRKLVSSVDASFLGTTTLLNMGVRRNAPSGQTDILGPNAGQFLIDMKEQVPLRRFDISGYGASIFSDWRRVLGPNDTTETAITKVLMNVINGRTSREIVKIQTVKAPFGVTVTKTVEIKRLNSGVIIRHESEWEPTSAGRYFYKNPNIVTHVGVIRGVTDVQNIKETSGTITPPNTTAQVILVNFDCIVEIEDAGTIRRVPARNLKGCIFTLSTDLAPVAGPAAGAETYMKVLDNLDLGGPVDFMIKIGTSGQKKRITSLSVRSGKDSISGTRVAVAAAWGSPVFEGGGQWSFAKIAEDRQPQPVDMGKGVPLVREGRHDSANLNSRVTSFLFKDPQYLLDAFPSNIYSIVHGAASHRVMFASPEIPFVQDVTKAIESKEVWLADSLALGKSTGIFPNLVDCLPVMPSLSYNASQLLELVPGGYVFEPKNILDGASQLDFPSLDPRVLKDDASVKTVVQVISKDLPGVADDVKSTLNLAINTARGISKMDITNINMVTSTVSATAKEASRVIGRLSSDVQKIGGLLGKDIDLGGPDVDKLLASPIHQFGPALEQVQKVISFLESLKFLPNFKVSMTNEWAMVMSTSMNREDLLEKIPEPSRPPVEKIIESFDFSLSSRTSLSSFLFKMHVGTTIKIPTGFGPVVALGTGAFDVALGTAGIEIKLELGFGIGVDLSVGPFSASASYTQSQTIIFDEDYWGVGITACMRAHVDLVVASADLYIEAKLLVVGGTCDPVDHEPHKALGTTIWGFAQVRIAVHVSIFLICNISVDEDAQWENNFNGGPCALDKMSNLVH